MTKDGTCRGRRILCLEGAIPLVVARTLRSPATGGPDRRERGGSVRGVASRIHKEWGITKKKKEMSQTGHVSSIGCRVTFDDRFPGETVIHPVGIDPMPLKARIGWVMAGFVAVRSRRQRISGVRCGEADKVPMAPLAGDISRDGGQSGNSGKIPPMPLLLPGPPLHPSMGNPCRMTADTGFSVKDGIVIQSMAGGAGVGISRGIPPEEGLGMDGPPSGGNPLRIGMRVIGMPRVTVKTGDPGGASCVVGAAVTGNATGAQAIHLKKIAMDCFLPPSWRMGVGGVTIEASSFAEGTIVVIPVTTLTIRFLMLSQFLAETRGMVGTCLGRYPIEVSMRVFVATGTRNPGIPPLKIETVALRAAIDFAKREHRQTMF